MKLTIGMDINPFMRDHGAETLAGRTGEDGRYVGDDTILITNH